MNSILDRFLVLTDKELDQAKRELANSYHQIRGSIAFRHMMEEMEKIKQDSYKKEDTCDIKDFNTALVAEARGMRVAIDMLKRKIENASK